MTKLVSLVALFAAILLVVVATPAGAPAMPYPDRFCGSIHASGGSWTITGYGPPCPRIRHWSRRYLLTGHEPRRWDCLGRGSEESSCDKRHSRWYFDISLED
jgi:hypothetical protein